MQRYYSNIFWHFTGSPPEVDWSEVREPKDIKGECKTPEQSVDILKAILSSQKLKATATEEILGEDVKTQEFCCVCDIPLKDLPSHTPYYGKAAVGFSSEPIYREFNPVLYMNEANMELFPLSESITIDDEHEINDDQTFHDDTPASELFIQLFGFEDNPEYKEYLDEHLGVLQKYLKLTKFSKEEDETFYRKREWRSIDGEFNFEKEDVEALIVPEEYTGEIKEELDTYNYEDNIPILTWGFIENV